MQTKSKISAHILRGAAAALFFIFVIVALSSAINLTNHPPKVPAPHNNAAFDLNGQESAASLGAPATRRKQTLTFADRVAYQRAIEEVYWRHRIWPKANAGPKPLLDKVMSQAQIEKKVEDYLRDSRALEDYWQRPITPDQLQAEMERIASHTKQPGVLREIFEALGNDPFVIAECLARSVLAERSLTELYAHDQRFHGELKRRAEAELKTHRNVKQMKQTSGSYTEMEWIKSDSADLAPSDAPDVVATPLRGVGRNVPQARGYSEPHGAAIRMNGSEWQESVEKLAAQFDSQDIVGQAPRLLNRRSAAQAFGAALQLRSSSSAEQADAHASAARPDAWAQIKTGVLSPLQEDEGHYYALAVLKKGKDRLKLATIAWLKEPLRSWLAKAEAQMPVTMAAVSANYTLPPIAGLKNNSSPSGGCTDDTWTPTSLTNAPDARFIHTAVWTGSEMIVWGGSGSTGRFNTGGRYDPSTDSWTATSTTSAPAGRFHHTAVWTGSEMIVWGGTGSGTVDLNTGGKYNPGTDSWTTTSTTGAPGTRHYHTAVWTGSEMIVWGGRNGDSEYLNSGGRYDPGTDSWTTTSTTSVPSSRFLHTAVWIGSEMVVWGGYDGTSFFNTGGRYDPSTDSWTDTSTTNAPSGRFVHTAVWTGSEMIVWGGADATNYFNTGGRYNPGTDGWIATSTTNAPSGRFLQKAVWTGSEMIVWGGSPDGGASFLNTGGRYDPITDSWTATSTTGAPAARAYHTAVWTGRQMIVWGGYDGTSFFNTGGRYCAVAPTPTGLVVSDLDHGVTPTDLVNTLLGAGFTISNVTYTGSSRAAGTFTGGTTIVGFESGIVLSAGKVQTVDDPACSQGVEGPNNCHELGGPDGEANSTDFGLPGDPDLTALSGFPTFDAAVLEFDFVPDVSNVQFQYVFSSEEYSDFANTKFNDVFAFFVNGVNCALVPGTNDPVSVNTINNGNDNGGDPTPHHPEFFRDNVRPTVTINIQMDGLTVVLTCTATVTPGVANHMKIAIADASDGNLDSAIFLKANSFTGATPTPTFTPTPTPTATFTPTPTATATLTPTPRPRPTVTPHPHRTPPPRP